MRTTPTLSDLLEEAARRPLLGWDLSYDRRIRSDPPWDFEAMADARMARSPDLLDMGTGGGEWLSRRPLPRGRTVATKGWPPNVSIARERLAPLGATVVAVAAAPDNIDQTRADALPALPFADGCFHLVTNRHESFVAAEVARVLAPGGAFLTQQVGSDLGAPFRALFGAPPGLPAPAWDLAEVLRQVRASGLEVTGCGEGSAQLAFTDVGALAWYLTNNPWVMPEFSLDAHRPGLERLHGDDRPVTAPQPLFWLTASKPV